MDFYKTIKNRGTKAKSIYQITCGRRKKEKLAQKLKISNHVWMIKKKKGKRVGTLKVNSTQSYICGIKCIKI